jgi:hypothetical protein
VIFFDRSILKGVVDAVKLVRQDDKRYDESRWLEDVFPHNPSIGETEWMPVIGGYGWLTVMRDMKVLTRQQERQAVSTSNLGCFNFNYKKNKSRWETLQLVCSTLDEMEEKFENTPRPFMYVVNGNGAFRSVDLSRPYAPRPVSFPGGSSGRSFPR